MKRPPARWIKSANWRAVRRVDDSMPETQSPANSSCHPRHSSPWQDTARCSSHSIQRIAIRAIPVLEPIRRSDHPDMVVFDTNANDELLTATRFIHRIISSLPVCCCYSTTDDMPPHTWKDCNSRSSFFQLSVFPRNNNFKASMSRRASRAQGQGYKYEYNNRKIKD